MVVGEQGQAPPPRLPPPLPGRLGTLSWLPVPADLARISIEYSHTQGHHETFCNLLPHWMTVSDWCIPIIIWYNIWPKGEVYSCTPAKPTLRYPCRGKIGIYSLPIFIRLAYTRFMYNVRTCVCPCKEHVYPIVSRTFEISFQMHVLFTAQLECQA